mgnify:CR=1 FL=1
MKKKNKMESEEKKRAREWKGKETGKEGILMGKAEHGEPPIDPPKAFGVLMLRDKLGFFSQKTGN